MAGIEIAALPALDHRPIQIAVPVGDAEVAAGFLELEIVSEPYRPADAGGDDEVAAFDAKDGKLTLDHVVKYNKECDDTGADEGRVAPMILPDYTDPRIRYEQKEPSAA